MTVDGRLAPDVNGPVKVNVTLHTPKGDYEQTATATSNFAITIRFDTWTSFSVWRGERCKNLPSLVVITANAAGTPPNEVRVKFKGNAFDSGILQFRLRREVVIDQSGIRLRDRPEAPARRGATGSPKPPLPNRLD